MTSLKVCLFGKFQVFRGDEPIKGLDIRKVQELLCYLLLYRTHSYPREMLAGLLWGDTSTAQAKKCMRQTLWQMQSALGGQNGLDHERLILVAPDWIQINTTADLWLDVAEFEQAFDQMKGRRGEELDPHTAQLVRDSVQLYQGDLLEGWYQDWCIYERERLQNIYLAMLEKLMAYHEAQQEYDIALSYGGQLLRYDHAHERTHRRLMSLHYMAGDRAAALRQYQRCVAALQEELDAQPSQRTTALYERIQADQQVAALSEAACTPAILPPNATSLHMLFMRLKQHWQALTNLERQIREDIDSLEVMLRDLNE
jgi:DNA-binding SARP family transcriptional activator